MIRIISGSLKGRKIQAPKNLPVRPTTDRVKESLFNILSNTLIWEETTVLDLYAGTGNISYEFASRGCPEVIAVDAHPGCAKFIEKTAESLDLHIAVYRRDVPKFLKQCRHKFDLIFADPPYAIYQNALEELVQLCVQRQLLKEGGILVLEHSSFQDLSALEGFDQVRKYGNSHLSIFTW